MKSKKFIIISIIGIFLVSFLAHNIYEWFPNKFTSIFFPVNESIWEHQKMTFTSIMFFGIIQFILLRNSEHNNFFFALVTSALTTILVTILVFTPIYYLMDKKDNLFITLIIYLFAIIIGQLVNCYILKNSKENKILNIISLISIPIIFTIFGYLTYYPINNDLFYDSKEEKYGIYTYYE